MGLEVVHNVGGGPATKTGTNFISVSAFSGSQAVFFVKIKQFVYFTKFYGVIPLRIVFVAGPSATICLL